MENTENNLPTENTGFGSNEITGYLHETAKWGKFLAIIGYIGMGMLVLVSIGLIVGFSIFNLTKNAEAGAPMGLIGIVYIVLAVIYYFPVTYLHRFSIRMKQGLTENDQQTITSGFENLKSLFKFLGIFTIIILSIYTLVLIVALPVSLLLLK